MRLTRAFDSIAEAYDRWYDTPEGRAIFNAELECLRLLRGRGYGRWLEVGVGTGRFACSLGIAEGIDPSPRMIEIAARRGVKVREGNAENLPFQDGSFDGVLMALALCFVASARQALKECRRVLLPDGRLLLGTVPADGPWGREYIRKASKGHPVYSLARFRTGAETMDLIQAAGFVLVNAAGTLFWKPGEVSQPEPRIENSISSEAGFLALLFERTASGVSGADDMKGRV